MFFLQNSAEIVRVGGHSQPAWVHCRLQGPPAWVHCRCLVEVAAVEAEVVVVVVVVVVGVVVVVRIRYKISRE